GGQDPATIGARRFVGDPAGGAEDAITEIIDNPPPASKNRVRHRSTAIRAAAPVMTGGSLWNSGQTPAGTFGPFQDRGGRLHWFDVTVPGDYFDIFVFGAPEPIALFPAGTRLGLGILTLPSGSIWLRASSLSAAAPGGNWTGLLIDSGTGTP